MCMWPFADKIDNFWQNYGICAFDFSDVSRHYEIRGKGWGLVQGMGASPVSYRHSFLVLYSRGKHHNIWTILGIVQRSQCIMCPGFDTQFSHFLYARQRQVVLCRAFRPSGCPSVNFSCPLHNFDTFMKLDIFMKLGTDINHRQTMYKEQEPTLHLHFLRNYGPLKFFWWKLCPLYNFDAIQNIFVKLCRNIDHHQMMCREEEP